MALLCFVGADLRAGCMDEEDKRKDMLSCGIVWIFGCRLDKAEEWSAGGAVE